MTNPILEAALAYATKGKPVFPCNAQKRPLVETGFKAATCDSILIQQWWETWPDALIGMPTGEASGVIVIDVDIDPNRGIDGRESLWLLTEEHGALPETFEVLTPRGGSHQYFSHPGGHVPCSASKLGRGIDIRGDGCYVIVPPSRVNGKTWEREASAPNQFAEMPHWLLALIRNGHSQDPVTPTTKTPPKNDSPIREGERDARLTSMAGAMRRQGMTRDEIEAALTAVNARCYPPLEAKQLAKIARSVGRYEPNVKSKPPSFPQIPPLESLFASMETFVESKPSPKRIVPGLLYADVSILAGPGGASKTTLLLNEYIHIVLGRALYGSTIENSGPCILITAEDSNSMCWARLRLLSQALALTQTEINELLRKIIILDVSGSVCRLAEQDNSSNIILTGFADHIVDRFTELEPAVVAFDSTIHSAPGSDL